jgi:mono/diheme cytochrome c family protein
VLLHTGTDEPLTQVVSWIVVEMMELHFVPKSYEGPKSTVPPGPQTIAAGSTLYGEHCAVCHGRDALEAMSVEDVINVPQIRIIAKCDHATRHHDLGS